MSKKLTKRSEDYSKWYNEIVSKAELAEVSAVRGCMVIKPYGYAIWEKIQKELDKKFKQTGHENAYFPLFVPKKLFEAEEKNAEGFAKECAVVTHYRLKNDPKNKGKLIVDEESKLEEELIVRPTSEAIIWNTYKNWIQSYRDLPIKINQWANVVRWEMRTRLFLRTAEFLWQEGHTAHSNEEEAIEETKLINNLYKSFAEDFMSISVISGTKSASERFAGAEETYCIEALMQDGKALQAGTSHFLGQNFAKAFDVKFSKDDGNLEYVWATSWGVSTRLVGALIMTHSDDDGLVLPPKLAPKQVVLLPIIKGDETRQQVLDYCETLKKDLESKMYAGGKVRVLIDDRDMRGGEKKWYHVKRGVPIRVEVGPRDIENNQVFVGRRDTGQSESVGRDEFVEGIVELLETFQQGLFDRALKLREDNTREIHSLEEFEAYFSEQDGQPAGFASCHFVEGEQEVLDKIAKYKVTIRCMPLEQDQEEGTCIFTGKPSTRRAIFGRSY